MTETLLRGVTPAAVERMRGEEPDGDAEAHSYGSLLPDRLDVTLLSMGEDGHCASLFLGLTLSSGEREAGRARPGSRRMPPHERITLTLPALEALAPRADPRARRAQARCPRTHPCG